MSPHVKVLPLIVAGVLLNAFAQLPLKRGLQATGGFPNSPLALIHLLLHPWILLGLLCYAISVIVWLGALSKVDVSYAYPFLALGFLANALLCRWFLGESIPPLRWIALTLIVAGVALQALTHRP